MNLFPFIAVRVELRVEIRWVRVTLLVHFKWNLVRVGYNPTREGLLLGAYFFFYQKDCSLGNQSINRYQFETNSWAYSYFDWSLHTILKAISNYVTLNFSECLAPKK